MSTYFSKQTELYYTRLLEKKQNSIDLLMATKFIHKASYKNLKINKIIINFSFKEIDFNKKHMAPYLILIEALTGQAAIATKAITPVLKLGIKKNTFVGCKVTLRKNMIYNLLDTFLLGTPRGEKNIFFDYKKMKKNKQNHFLTWLDSITKFFQTQHFQDDSSKQMSVVLLYNTSIFDEKIFLLTSYNIPIKK